MAPPSCLCPGDCYEISELPTQIIMVLWSILTTFPFCEWESTWMCDPPSGEGPFQLYRPLVLVLVSSSSWKWSKNSSKLPALLSSMKTKLKRGNTSIAVTYLEKEEKYKTLPRSTKKKNKFSVVKRRRYNNQHAKMMCVNDHKEIFYKIQQK